MSGFAHKLPVPMECRNTDQLPLQKHVSRKAAGLLGASAMFMGTIAIAVVAAAFYVFNDLKVQDVQVVGAALDGYDCQSIAKVTAKTDFSDGLWNLYLKTHLNSSGWRVGGPVDFWDYSGAFGTAAACYSAVKMSCTYSIVPAGMTNKGSGMCNATIKGEVSFKFTIYNSSGGPPMDFTILSDDPSINRILESAASLYSSATVCAPYIFNPPYLCTRMVRLSSLQIAAQSLSIGSSVHAGWLMIGAFLLGVLSKYCWKETPDTPEPTYHTAVPATAASSATSVVTVELAAKPISVEGATENPVATSTDA